MTSADVERTREVLAVMNYTTVVTETMPDAAHLDALRGELAETERKLANLRAAIAEGGDVPALVTHLQAHDEQRRALRVQIETAEKVRLKPNTTTTRKRTLL